MSKQSTVIDSRSAGSDLGHDAESPTDIPAKGWWQITRRSLGPSAMR